jgi:hypothetical protein
MPAENVDFDRFTDPPRAKPQPRFTLIPFNQIRRRQTSSYLIKGLIGATGLIVAWGPPKCGKSFWVFDAVMHIATGWEYRGRRVTQGNVVYLALEGQDGFADRVDAFRQQRFEDGVGDVPGFYLVKERTDLVKDTAELIKCIQSQCTAGKPAVVVIDTMNRSLVGSESKDEDMAAYIKAADIIKETFQCAVIIIHHCGIDGTRPRGHTSLTGAADVQISVKKDAAKNIIVTVECAKDMPEGAVITSRLEAVDLGEDQDGDQITSCVVLPVDDAEQATAPVKPIAKLAPSLKIALTALGEAILDSGVDNATPRCPTGLKAVPEKLWREYAYKSGISSGGNRAQQKAFKDATTKLVASRIVGTWDGWYWLVRENF